MSTDFRLSRLAGHLFAEIAGEEWVIDTGSPASFGTRTRISVGDACFSVAPDYMGLTGTVLTGLVGHPTAGIIGTDILNEFDVLFDESAGRMRFSREKLDLTGVAVGISDFMGVPVVRVEIDGASHKMFLDTGAQVSYLQDEQLQDYPDAGVFHDFFPGVGAFETTTHRLPVAVGALAFELRCGTLPGLLGMTLAMAGTSGIVGNELFAGRVVGYFPRRRQLVFA